MCIDLLFSYVKKIINLKKKCYFMWVSGACLWERGDSELKSLIKEYVKQIRLGTPDVCFSVILFGEKKWMCICSVLLLSGLKWIKENKGVKLSKIQKNYFRINNFTFLTGLRPLACLVVRALATGQKVPEWNSDSTLNGGLVLFSFRVQKITIALQFKTNQTTFPAPALFCSMRN